MHRIGLGLELRCVLTALLSSLHELCGDRNMAQGQASVFAHEGWGDLRRLLLRVSLSLSAGG